MAAMPADPTKLLENARQWWHTCYGLLVAEIIGVVIALAIIAALPLPTYAKLLMCPVAIVCIFCAWALCRRLPRTKKGKVGFVISIAPGSGTDPLRVREDFVLSLQELVKHGESGPSFHVIAIPAHVAEKVVDQDNALRLCRKCRAHFVIYGRVRLRRIGGRDVHILHLNGLVKHRPVPAHVSGRFSREFSQLLPRRLRIAGEDDEVGFYFTAGWVDCVARYIIAIAAALSWDLDYAERLLNDTRDLLRGKPHEVPVYAQLAQRVPALLTDVHLTRGHLACLRWHETRDIKHMEAVGRELSSISSLPLPAGYGAAQLRATYLFVHDGDVKAAIAALKKCKANLDANRLYSMGFLYAYAGDLDSATRCYRNAARYHTEPIAIAQIEEFIEWALKEEPARYQLHYCLGHINCHIKGDRQRAEEEFKAFLSSGGDGEFSGQRALARTWITEMSHTSARSSL